MQSEQPNQNLANNEYVKKVLIGAKVRQIRIDNPFWPKFMQFMSTEVRDSFRSNGIRMSLCCWTLLRRKGGGYVYHPEVISLSKIAKYEDTLWNNFLELALQNGFRNEVYMKIPSLDLPHIGMEEEPASNDIDQDIISQSEIPTLSDLSLKSLPASQKLSLQCCPSSSKTSIIN